MARLTGPLHSLAASGRVGDKLVFRDAVVGPQVVHRVSHADAQSATQLTQRSYFADAAAKWAAFDLTTLDRSTWLAAALDGGQTWSRYNAFQHAVIACRRAGNAWNTLRWDSVTRTDATHVRYRWRQDGAALTLSSYASWSPHGPWRLVAGLGAPAGGLYTLLINDANWKTQTYVIAANSAGGVPRYHSGPLDRTVY